MASMIFKEGIIKVLPVATMFIFVTLIFAFYKTQYSLNL
ncbi:hypothetical protein B4123_2487 [Bacillus paralicheniformis]|nr:hypothetical protein B4123_2487 [Bacillus paralicheniformis]TWK23517.1 hypothetical protein CHCC20372_3924 [Bacillus paralicheniformis]